MLARVEKLRKWYRFVVVEMRNWCGCCFQKAKNAVKTAATTDQSSGQTRLAVSQDGSSQNKAVSRKWTTVLSPKCKRNVRASGKTVKVNGTSDEVSKPRAGKTRPKRRCRQLVNYGESADSVDQSSDDSSDDESTEPHHQQEMVTVPNKGTTKRRSDEVAPTTCRTKEGSVRSLIVFVTWQTVIVITCCCLFA